MMLSGLSWLSVNRLRRWHSDTTAAVLKFNLGYFVDGEREAGRVETNNSSGAASMAISKDCVC